MTDILKTWPASMSRARVLKAFTHDWGTFYFTLGPRKPKQGIDRLWYTHQGEIVGSFKVERLAQNDGSFPKLRSITGEVSEWQIKRDAWVALCGHFVRLMPCKNCLSPIWKGMRDCWQHSADHSYLCPVDEGMSQKKQDYEEILRNCQERETLSSLHRLIDSFQLKGAEIGGRIYHEAFRGWRYFDLESYRLTMEAKVQL